VEWRYGFWWRFSVEFMMTFYWYDFGVWWPPFFMNVHDFGFYLPSHSTFEPISYRSVLTINSLMIPHQFYECQCVMNVIGWCFMLCVCLHSACFLNVCSSHHFASASCSSLLCFFVWKYVLSDSSVEPRVDESCVLSVFTVLEFHLFVDILMSISISIHFYIL